MSNLSKRIGGLEPLPATEVQTSLKHLSSVSNDIEAKSGNESVSPLKRRPKVVIQGFARVNS